jgi:hypothetical protein
VAASGGRPSTPASLRHEELDEVTIGSEETRQTASNFTTESISVDEIALNPSRSLTEW